MLPYAILIAGTAVPMGLMMLVWERAPFVRFGSAAAYTSLAVAVLVFASASQLASDVAYADARERLNPAAPQTKE